MTWVERGGLHAFVPEDTDTTAPSSGPVIQDSKTGVKPVNPAELAEALDALEDVINQACMGSDGVLDSCALGAYADGMRLLAKHGRLVIDSEAYRRVIGHWPTDGAA